MNNISRRDFLKMSLASIASIGLLFGPSLSLGKQKSALPNMEILCKSWLIWRQNKDHSQPKSITFLEPLDSLEKARQSAGINGDMGYSKEERDLIVPVDDRIFFNPLTTVYDSTLPFHHFKALDQNWYISDKLEQGSYSIIFTGKQHIMTYNILVI